MFNDLKDSYKEMMKNCSHVVYDGGVHISFPEKLFAKFEQEYNLCFVEAEDDVMFQSWQDGHKDKDE